VAMPQRIKCFDDRWLHQAEFDLVLISAQEPRRLYK
jgi:hypothetical protein